MRRAPLAQRCLYFQPGDRQAEQRREVADWKRSARAAIHSLGARPRFVAAPRGAAPDDRLVRIGRAAEAAFLARTPAQPRAGSRSRGRPADAGASTTAPPQLRHPTCMASFDANSKVTTISATAEIDADLRTLAKAVDPRGWGLSNGVIDVAYRVCRDDHGAYSPLADDLAVSLGTPWERGLLFEYARSEVASFENILAIDAFEVTPQRLAVTYRLADCLKTILGFWSTDGGLQRNDGFVTVERDGRRGCHITVEKNIRVRDLTPNDPGNRYDFGQSLNATLGAALSSWVDDVSLMSPVF